ncbi:hypothetical protein HHI36_012294 [Cryptolaemus montrouzieri]|uniref:Ionotropic receptor n=1 Tax=Cryptolaemus montrouzieri TaxID=559131 RepID=A0ABD2NDT1_9CUCU
MLALEVIETYNILKCVEAILTMFINNKTLIVVGGDNIRINLPIIQLNFEKQPGGIEHLFDRRFDAYVIDLEYVPFDNFMKSLREQSYFYRTAKFIFIGKEFSRSLMRKISLNFLGNTMFVNCETLEVSSYSPFKEGSWESADTNLELMGNCNPKGFDVSGLWRNRNTLFPDIIPRKLRQSTIKVLVLFYVPYTMYSNSQKRGIEIELLNAILDVINVTASYTKPHAAPSLQLEIDMNTSSIILGMGFTRFQRFRNTVAYTTDQLCLFVPSASPIPKWKYVYKAFSENVWGIWFFISVVVCILWYIIDSVFRKQRQIYYCFKKPFVLLKLSLEQNHNLDYTFSSQCCLMVIIVFLIFFINIFYKSRFTFLLSGLNFEKGMETFDDIMDGNLELDYYEPDRENFADNSKFYEYMKKHFHNCTDPFTCTNRTAFKKDMVVLRFRRTIRYVAHTYYTDPESGKALINEFFPPVHVNSLSFNILDGHPIFQSVQRILRYFRDNGIVDYYIKKYDDFHSKEDTVDNHKISVKDLSGGDLGNIDTNLELVGYSDDDRISMSRTWGNYNTLYPDIIPKKWRKSRIKVLLVSHIPYAMYTNNQKRGIEFELLNSILDAIDVIAIYTRPYIMLLDTNIVDFNTFVIIIGLGFSRVRRCRNTVAYTTDELFWYVPSASPIPKWKYVYKSFSEGVWGIWFSIVAILSILWYITDRVFRKQKQIYHYFEKPFFLLKLSRFTYLLSGLNFEKDLETLEDFMEADLKLEFYGTQLDFFLDNPTFKEKTWLLFDTEELYTDPESGKPLIQEFVPSKQVDNFSFKILDGHPIFQSFERILRYFRDNGIVDYFMQKYDNFYSMKEDKVDNHAISIRDLSGVFIFWLIGLMINILVFSFEFKLHKEFRCKFNI